MPPWLALRMTAATSAAAAARTWRSISARRMPRRRCVISTETQVSPVVATSAPPGTVIVNGTSALSATIRSSSRATSTRDGSMSSATSASSAAS
jgi:hypothetical protein